MNTKTFADIWFSLGPDQKKALAEKAGTSVDHLRQVAGGHRNIGCDLAERLLLSDKRLNLYVIGWGNIANALKKRGELVKR